VSFLAEVITNNEAGGDWRSNRLRFATAAEARDYACDLAARWSMVTETRVTEIIEPANYRYINGELLAVVSLIVHETEPDNIEDVA
jgi:hypothetical protein